MTVTKAGSGRAFMGNYLWTTQEEVNGMKLGAVSNFFFLAVNHNLNHRKILQLLGIDPLDLHPFDMVDC